MADRIVTEADFRAPEFRDAKVEDYEWRDDGKLVRKDRWETGIRRIANRLGLNNWEIETVVERVNELLASPDSERLNWLEQEANSLLVVEDGAELYFQIISHHMARPAERIEGVGPTVRDAIDAARGGKQPEVSNG